MALKWNEAIDPGDGSELGYLRVHVVQVAYRSKVVYLEVRGWRNEQLYSDGKRIAHDARFNLPYELVAAATQPVHLVAEAWLMQQPQYAGAQQIASDEAQLPPEPVEG